MLRAPSSLILKVTRDETSTTSLGNLCQCLTALIINYFLIFYFNPPSFSLESLSLMGLSCKLPWSIERLQWDLPEASSSPGWTNSTQSFLTGEVLQPPDHPCVIRTCFNRSMASLCWGPCSTGGQQKDRISSLNLETVEYLNNKKKIFFLCIFFGREN